MQSCYKITLQLTALAILLFTSCQKEILENSNVSSPNTHNLTEYPSDVVNELNEVDFTDAGDHSASPPQNVIDNSEAAVNVERTIRDVTVSTIVQTVFYPQIYGLQNGGVTTRSGCPDSELQSSTDPSGANIHVITLDYGSGCNIPGSNAFYEGIITLELKGDLNQPGTTGKITFSDDFKIDSENDIDGLIELIYQEENGQPKYGINDLNITSTNTTTNKVTSATDAGGGLSGGYFIVENTEGDVGNMPTNILNDNLQYDGCMVVQCPDTQVLRTCSISGIDYDILCGLPFDGETILDTLNTDGSYGNGTTVGTFGNLDYAYPNLIGEGVCDDEVKFTDNNGVTEIIKL